MTVKLFTSKCNICSRKIFIKNHYGHPGTGDDKLFGVDIRTINEHLRNIYKTSELEREPTIRKIRIVQKEGSRDVARDVDFFNLDAIIAVGYRVNSYQATQFRIWQPKPLGSS